MEHSYTSASGFPMGVEKIGGAFQNLMGGRGGLSQYRERHAGLKECS